MHFSVLALTLYKQDQNKLTVYAVSTFCLMNVVSLQQNW